MPRYQLRIEVNVEGPERTDISQYINDALRELTNRRDFRQGEWQVGRQLKQAADRGDVEVTVDAYRFAVPGRRD